jgi:hypothetical protein
MRSTEPYESAPGRTVNPTPIADFPSEHGGVRKYAVWLPVTLQQLHYASGRYAEAAQCRGAQARLSLAHHMPATGTRTNWYFQSLVLRRSAHHACASRNPGHSKPTKTRARRNAFLERSIRSIVELEAHLNRNGTQIVKVFLHLSKKEQKNRFIARIDEPDKNWKFSQSDIHERTFWKRYTRAFADCLAATSTHHSPWYAVPADDKENARLIVSQIVMEALDDLKMAYPKTTAKRLRELELIRKKLRK